MVVAAKYVKLVCEKNTNFGFTVKYKLRDGTPIALSDAVLQVRPTPGGALIVDMSVANGKLVIGGAGSNEITGALTIAQTLALPAGVYFYDLIADETVSTLQRRLIQGVFEISANITI